MKGGFKRKALTLFIGVLTYAGFTLYQSSRFTTNNTTKYFWASTSTSTLASASASPSPSPSPSASPSPSPSASNIQYPTLASNASLANNVDALVHDTGGPLLLALNSPRKFISYKLVKDLPFLNVYDPLVCSNHIFTEPFKEPGIMDFHMSIDTNLNIMFVGDSVSTQFAQLLQEATHPIKRQTIRYAWGNMHEGSHIAATPANGTVASIRVTGLMLHKTRDKARWMAPNGGGGWNASDIREMKRLIHQWRPVHTNVGIFRKESFCERQQESVNMSYTSSTDEYSCEQNDFDVVVHQFSPAWLGNFEEIITWDVIDEMVNIAFDTFGATTVVLQTIQIMNNVKGLDQLFKVNDLIWKYARDFQAKQTETGSPRGRAKRKVLVMDTFAYTFSMYLQNSMAIGLIPSNIGNSLQQQLRDSTEYDTYLNLTLSLSDIFNSTTITVTQKGYRLHYKKGQVYADSNFSKKSLTSSDGQHWCSQATGGRLNAALACLLRCSFETDYDDSAADQMKDCEWRCNKQYMSLAPVLWDDAERLKIKLSMVDLKNTEIVIETNSTPVLANY